MKIKIFPSLISSDLLNLERTIQELEPHCDGFHIDVMDNHFVPNLTWGPAFVNRIAQCSKKPLSVHLMTEKTEEIIEQLRLKPESSVAFHCENNNPQDLISLIKSKKLKASIAINPKTPLGILFPYLDTVDQVLLMSVEPGFSGQQFLPESVFRLKTINDYKQQHHLSFEVAMDGGITANNINQLAQAGCSYFCIATAIFNTQNHLQALEGLYKKATGG